MNGFSCIGYGPVFLCTDELVPSERAMVVQAKVNGDEEGFFILTDKKPKISSSKIHLTSLLTKCRKSQRVTLGIVNVTQSPVQMKRGDEIAEMELFQKIEADQAKDQAQKVIRPSDLNIGHLCTEEQQHLCHILNESGSTGQTKLWKTTTIEHSISASPIKQKPYRVPEKKERSLKKRYRRR